MTNPDLNRSPYGTTRRANPQDLAYITDLARKFTNEIGFIPRAAVEWYIAAGCVRLAFENGTPCGYLLGRPQLRYAPWCKPITQAAVQMDSQRRHHGLKLVEEICRQATADGKAAVQCWCAADLESNDFWRAAGFSRICQRDAKNTRGRPLILWRRRISLVAHPEFWTPPPRAGWKAAKTTADSVLIPDSTLTADP